MAVSVSPGLLVLQGFWFYRAFGFTGLMPRFQYSQNAYRINQILDLYIHTA